MKNTHNIYSFSIVDVSQCYVNMSKLRRNTDNVPAKSKRISCVEERRMILDSDEESNGSHCSDLEMESDDSDYTVIYNPAAVVVGTIGVSSADQGANTCRKLYGAQLTVHFF